jgi:hypothetical protein
VYRCRRSRDRVLSIARVNEAVAALAQTSSANDYSKFVDVADAFMALLSDATSQVAHLQKEVLGKRRLPKAMPSPAWDWEAFHRLHKFLYGEVYPDPLAVLAKALVMIEVIEKLAAQAGVKLEQMRSMKPAFQELLSQRQGAGAASLQATA